MLNTFLIQKTKKFMKFKSIALVLDLSMLQKLMENSQIYNQNAFLETQSSQLAVLKIS